MPILPWLTLIYTMTFKMSNLDHKHLYYLLNFFLLFLLLFLLCASFLFCFFHFVLSFRSFISFFHFVPFNVINFIWISPWIFFLKNYFPVSPLRKNNKKWFIPKLNLTLRMSILIWIIILLQVFLFINLVSKW